MTKRSKKNIQNELDQLKELKLAVCDPLKSVIVISGGTDNITFHAKHGQPQNILFFPAMMKALKEKLNERIAEIESELEKGKS